MATARLSRGVLAVLGMLAWGVVMAEEPAPGRERLLMDSGWRFALGHARDAKADFKFGDQWTSLAKQDMDYTVTGFRFTDTSWRQVDLPHDWGMELPFTTNGVWAWGNRPLGIEFPETSIGWYRKRFTIPASDKGRRISLEFDGVSRNCMVFVNGILMGYHASGYTSFQFDATDAIRFGAENVVAVRVDASLNEGWWYQGAGIYRHVWLTKTPPVHVTHWGTQVLTETRGSKTEVKACVTVRNDSDQPASVAIEAAVVDAAGETVARVTTESQCLEAAGQQEFRPVLKIKGAKLWSLEEPVLYRLVTNVKQGRERGDRTETPFGIRTIKFDPDHGFFLNGKRVQIRGFCDHQHHGGLGVAVPDALWAWRILKLKEMGCNAIRMAHNPPAPEFLDACDRLGMLVMDEQRLFSCGEEGLGQLDSMVRRDRNHPSVIIWSLGNEEKQLEVAEASAPVMKAMQDLCHRLDPSRPATYAASNGGFLIGANQVADVRGINYLHIFSPKNASQYRVGTVDEYHARFPNQPIIGTEDSCGPQPKADPWEFSKQHEYFAGYFAWTGFGYYGESGWPSVSGYGAVDLCGFPRKHYWYYRQEWAGLGAKPKEELAGKAVAIVGEPDRAAIRADGEDIAVVNLSVVDAKGVRVTNANVPFDVELTGPGRVLVIANGNDGNHELRNTAHWRMFAGRAQVLVQAARAAGTLHLKIKAEGLNAAELPIQTSACTPRPWVP